MCNFVTIKDAVKTQGSQLSMLMLLAQWHVVSTYYDSAYLDTAVQLYMSHTWYVRHVGPTTVNVHTDSIAYLLQGLAYSKCQLIMEWPTCKTWSNHITIIVQIPTCQNLTAMPTLL